MHFKIWILAKENVRFMPPNKRNKKKSRFIQFQPIPTKMILCKSAKKWN